MTASCHQRWQENLGLAFVGSERLGPNGEAVSAKPRSEDGAEDRMSEDGL
jgi:hypothetical protein